MHIIIIGGGAAGFFAAANIPKGHQITLLEKSGKVLSKVLVSGGGRCNVTHHAFEIAKLIPAYPRGEKVLRQAFKTFQPKDTIDWFAKRGVELHTEADGRMFPTTNNSETIVDCLYEAAIKNGTSIQLHTHVDSIVPENYGFTIHLQNGEQLHADKVICAMGGSAMLKHYEALENNGLAIIPPVASLFTFNTINKQTAELMGISVASATVEIIGLKEKSSGAVLFTHWGFSGPAVLKLSALAARFLKEKEYRYSIKINWTGNEHQDAVYNHLINLKKENNRTLLKNMSLYELPKRMFLYFIEQLALPLDTPFAELSHKHLALLSAKLTTDTYPCQGKTTFKEEFVTCGGVSLSEIHHQTMESKQFPGLYFAGELLDIDGVTGGFNFQSAWTTAWLAAKAIG